MQNWLTWLNFFVFETLHCNILNFIFGWSCNYFFNIFLCFNNSFSVILNNLFSSIKSDNTHWVMFFYPVIWSIIQYLFQDPGGGPGSESCFIQFVETNQFMSILCAMMAFYIPVSIMCGLYVRCSCRVQSMVYSVQCTVYSVQFTLYTVHCTL